MVPCRSVSLRRQVRRKPQSNRRRRQSMAEPIAAVAGGAPGAGRAAAWLAGAAGVPREIQPLPGDVSPRRYFRVVSPGGLRRRGDRHPRHLSAGGAGDLPAVPAHHRDPARRRGAGAARAGARLRRRAGCWSRTWARRRSATGGGGAPGASWPATSSTRGSSRDRIARLPAGRPRGAQSAARPRAAGARAGADLGAVPRAAGAGARPRALAAALRAALDTLCATLGGEPPVPCHRDFMARNLMPLPPREAPAGSRCSTIRTCAWGRPATTSPRCSTTRSSRRRTPRRRCSPGGAAGARRPRPLSPGRGPAHAEGGGDLRQVRPPGGEPPPAADRADPGPLREAFFADPGG